VAEHADLLSSVGLCVSVAAVLAFAAHRLKQPLLLAYLLAGVLIGPQIGLSLVDDQKSIETVSEIGLILLLFIIGLELDLNKLLTAGKPVLVTGILQFPLCVALGLAFFLPFGFGAGGGGFGLPYVAVCLAMSSTMVVVKLLYDKFELDTLPGRITLGVLVFQDIWAMVVLGIQPNLLQPELGTLLASLGKGVLLVATSFLVSKTVLPRLFRSAAKMPELVLVGSLAWCFIVAGGASAAGLSREMGALIAGVSISTFPYNMDVVAKVISVRDFFVTLFFVALGMQIPMPTAQIVGLALLASAFLVVSRFAVVFPILHALGLGHRTSLLPSVNLAQMSEFSLVIATIGVTYQHIGHETVSVLIFVFAFTAVASTYMIGYSHSLQELFARGLRKAGVNDLDARVPEVLAEHPHAGKDVVVLGFFVEASALIHEYELNAAGGRHPVLDRLQPGGPRRTQPARHRLRLRRRFAHGNAASCRHPERSAGGLHHSRFDPQGHRQPAAAEAGAAGLSAGEGDRHRASPRLGARAVRGRRRLRLRAVAAIGGHDGGHRAGRAAARVRQPAGATDRTAAPAPRSARLSAHCRLIPRVWYRA